MLNKRSTKMNGGKILPVVVCFALVLLISTVSACSSAAASTTSTPTSTPNVNPGPGGGALVNSDSIVTAQIRAIRKLSSGYPLEIDILVQSSVDVGLLPNPTKDSVGKVITVKTDQDLTAFKVNDVVTAKVKYVGDVPKPGVILYIYNVALQALPK
jgi:hypothetical protein